MGRAGNDNDILHLLSDMHEKEHPDIENQIKEAIESGFTSKDSTVQMEWARIFGTDEMPDMETFIRELSLYIRQN